MKTVPLRWLIVTPFVLLALISGVTMYFLSTVTISNVATGVGKQYLKEVEGRIRERVQDFMSPLSDIAEMNLHAFSNRPEMLDDLNPIGGRFYEQATPYLYMTFISVATADGRYVSSSQSPFDGGRHNIAANYLHKPLTMEGFEYDPNAFIGGKIESDPVFSYDPRTRPFYLDAIREKGMVWSDIAPYYGFPTLGVGLSAPIYDVQGKLLGVTATSIALIELDRYLESLDLVKGAYVFLAEADGALIATSKHYQLYSVEDGVTTRANLKSHTDKVFQSASQHLDSGMKTLRVDDEEYLYYLSPISLDYGQEWQIGILIPDSYHRAVLSDYIQGTIFITLLLFVCIGLIGSLIAWYIGKPIERLNQVVHAKQLKSVQQLPKKLSGVREINSLGHGMSVMANELADIMQNLEEKVAERTSLLQGENEHLLESAMTDELTGLYNRRGFNQVFETKLDYAQQNQQSLTVVLCDIDHFKRINDTYGHAVGDLALVSVARVLKHHVRLPSDLVARYGGEEFTLVFVDTELEEVLRMLDTIRHDFLIEPVVQGQHITMSFGVVHVDANESVSVDGLIGQADKKLYQAKNGGRDKIIV